MRREDASGAGSAPRVLRRGRTGDRDRRTGAGEIWPADLCAARDRAQPSRRRAAACQGRPVCRRDRRGAAGIGDEFERRAGERGLPVIDATCPLVSKVHIEGQRYANQGREIILIGHAGHPEIQGTMGRITGRVHLISRPEEVARLNVADPDKLAFITQTTLSVDDTRAVIEALKARFPSILGPDTKDICYATQNRQRAARELAKIVDVVLVVGAPNSSNSNRLREIAAECGVPSYLIEDARALDPQWLKGASSVGITAGASAPDALVEELIARLRETTEIFFFELPAVTENVRFRIPTQLTDRPSRG